MKTHHVYLAVLSMVVLTTGGWTNLNAAETLTANQIMTKVDTRTEPQDLTATITMNLIDSKNQSRQRLLKTYRFGDDKQIMWFLEPADVKGSSFLRISHDDQDDDMWLYLPAFGKVKRIASHAKKGSFMGTDFTFEDLGERKLKEYRYTLLKEEEFNAQACWVIESLPQKGVNTDYAKIVSWIWKDDFFAVKEEFYDRAGVLMKVKTVELTELKPYWVIKQMTMEDLKAIHKTEMIFDQIQVDTGLDEKIFDTNSLKRIR
jgi:hypothetical protein